MSPYSTLGATILHHPRMYLPLSWAAYTSVLLVPAVRAVVLHCCHLFQDWILWKQVSRALLRRFDSTLPMLSLWMWFTPMQHPWSHSWVSPQCSCCNPVRLSEPWEPHFTKGVLLFQTLQVLEQTKWWVTLTSSPTEERTCQDARRMPCHRLWTSTASGQVTSWRGHR